MRAYIDQIYYEGLGANVYSPIKNILLKINSKLIRKILINILNIIYFIIAIIISVGLFIITFPL